MEEGRSAGNVAVEYIRGSSGTLRDQDSRGMNHTSQPDRSRVPGVKPLLRMVD